MAAVLQQPLPRNARAIVEARAGGLRPADAVAVSLVGSLGWANPTVYADPDARLDWRWARGLDVLLVVAPDRKPGRIVRDLVAADVHDLHLVDLPRRRGAWVLPVGHRLRVFPWLPFRNEEFFGDDE